MKKNEKTGLIRIRKAFFYSWDGLNAAFQNEAAFRQEVLLACLMIPIPLFLSISIPMRAMMIGSLFLVLIVEILNSAIEAIVDRISLERHPLSKRAKDLGSAAVFLSLINVLGIWLLGFREWLQQ